MYPRCYSVKRESQHKTPYQSFILLNLDISFDIENRLFRFFVVVFGIMIEGTVPQNCYLGPSFCVI